MHDIKNKINKAINDNKDEIIAFVQELVRTPSLANQESDVQHIIHNKLNSIGLNSKIIPVIFSELEHHPAFNDDGFSPDSRINVTALWQGNNNAKSLILNGHVDVVPTGPEKLWDDDPFSGNIIDGKIYGRGSCDMKAGLSSGLFAISILKNLGFAPDGDIIFQSVVGEESGGCGTLTNIVKGYGADAAIILEPTSLKLSPIQSGALTFRLKVPGKATHASMRWDGISAIEKYSLIHQSIINFEKERHDSFDVEYYQSKDRVAPINIGTIAGGQWHSTVPESIIAEGRLGVFPGESNAKAKQSFEGHINKFAESDNWLKDHPPVIEWFEGQFESGQTPLDHPLIKELDKIYTNVSNQDAIIEGVTYGSDLRLFTNHANIPSVLFGPGDVRLAHAANENILIDEILISTEVVANMIVNWCGGNFE
ncbi:MAG: ArgE/DapE family deacylase [Candidatus Neomarinimicrobiota bacterium]|nr:ArgE/DapE family deacylase [Candidatus Neomarinimicrobiota bacterium]